MFLIFSKFYSKSQIVNEEKNQFINQTRNLSTQSFQQELKKQKLLHYKKYCTKKLIGAASTVQTPLPLNPKAEKKNLSKIKKLCPSIQKTCCHYDELEYLFNDVEYGFDTFLRWNYNQIQRFTNTINNIQDQMIDDYIRENQENLEHCVYTKDPWAFKDIFMEIKAFNKDLKKMYVNYAKEAFLDQYRLQCALCDQKYNRFFVMDQKKKHGSYTIKVDARKEMPYIFEIWNKGKFLRRLRLAAKIMNCAINQESSLLKEKELIFDEQMQKLLDEKNAVAIYDNHKYQKYFKSNYLTGGVQDIFFQRFSKLIEQHILKNGTIATNRRISTKWIPLEINDPVNPDYSVANVEIQADYSKGYYSKDINLGQSSYIKNLYIILNLEEEDNEDDSSNSQNFVASLVFMILYLIN